MTYEGRLELHLRHLKQEKKSPYADEFANYVKPANETPEKSVEDKALDKISEKVGGKIIDVVKPEEPPKVGVNDKKETGSALPAKKSKVEVNK